MICIFVIIYKTTNLINGKIYVGKDKKDDPKYLGSGVIFKRALKKYGIINFNKSVIEECYTLLELNARETYWIKTLNSTDRKIGYNIAIGGNGGDTITNNPDRADILLKIKNNNFGKHTWTDEMKKRQSDALRGIPKSEEHRKNLSTALTGKRLSAETILKLSISHKGKGRGSKNSMYGKPAWNSGIKMPEEIVNKMCGTRESMAGKNNSRYIDLTQDQRSIIINNYPAAPKAKIKKLLFEKTGLKICSATLTSKIRELTENSA